MTGRLTSIFVSKLLKPRTMVVSSLASCVLASILIVATGTTQKYGIYAGTGIMVFIFITRELPGVGSGEYFKQVNFYGKRQHSFKMK